MFVSCFALRKSFKEPTQNSEFWRNWYRVDPSFPSRKMSLVVLVEHMYIWDMYRFNLLKLTESRTVDNYGLTILNWPSHILAWKIPYFWQRFLLDTSLLAFLGVMFPWQLQCQPEPSSIKFHWIAAHEIIFGHAKKVCLELNISNGQ